MFSGTVSVHVGLVTSELVVPLKRLRSFLLLAMSGTVGDGSSTNGEMRLFRTRYAYLPSLLMDRFSRSAMSRLTGGKSLCERFVDGADAAN